jgi:polyisoprenyl-phosphate glycosyltransferase
MEQNQQNLERNGISAVIPAYNEAGSITSVLNVLRQVNTLDEILVVDDGSTDNTAEVVNQCRAQDPRIVLLRLPENQGKGNALLAGADAASSSLLLFLDADLKDLAPLHIHNLIEPVQRRACAISVGLFEDGRWKTNLTHHLFPFLSGQRCLRWSLFKNLYREKINGWSIETALNLHAYVSSYPVNYVVWPGVTHAIRTEKRGSLAGCYSHIRMWLEIGQYFFHFARHRMRPGRITHHKDISLPQPTLTKQTMKAQIHLSNQRVK